MFDLRYILSKSFYLHSNLTFQYVVSICSPIPHSPHRHHVGQMTALSGTIEANSGPLSAAFQQRVKYALYLIIAAVVFGFFAGKKHFLPFFLIFSACLTELTFLRRCWVLGL